MNLLELQKYLDENSAWRKEELSIAKSLAENAKEAAIKKYLCRTWTLIMYAHCDNFLKKAIAHYIEYIEGDIPQNYRIDTMWLIFKGKEHIKYASAEKYISPLSQDDNLETYLCALKSDPVLKGRSFSYKSLRFYCDWVFQLHFPHSEKKWFCDSLERKRNAIAHGEESYIDDIQDCVKWHEETIKFMDDLKDAIVLNAPKVKKVQNTVVEHPNHLKVPLLNN